MIPLLASESLRFRSRRMVRVLAVTAIVGIVVGGAITASQSHRPSEDQVAAAEHKLERQIERCVRNDGYDEGYGPKPAGTSFEEYCRNVITLDQFEPGGQLKLGDLPEILMGAAFITMVLGLVIGASAVGASWQTGTITTILTWEPRRIRWLVARLVVTALGVFLLTAFLLVVLSFVMALVAALRGSTELPPGWWGETIGAILRIGAVCASASVVAAAVASIGRNTTAALGAVFVYLAVVENLVRGLRPAMSRFTLGDSAAVIISGEAQKIFDGRTEITITPMHGVIVMAGWLAVLTLVAFALLRARDVQ